MRKVAVCGNLVTRVGESSYGQSDVASVLVVDWVLPARTREFARCADVVQSYCQVLRNCLVWVLV